MADSQDLRRATHNVWTGDPPLSIEQVKLGCMLRIADATEVMAREHQRLVNRAKELEASRDYWLEASRRLEKEAVYLRANVTRFRNRLKKLLEKTT
jgi:hypothetical protein